MIMYMIMYIIANISFLKYKKYLLMNLVILEFIMVTNCNLMFFILMKLNLKFYLIYLLVFLISESTLGLSLLVILVRYHGNDSVKFLNLILMK